MNFEFLEDIIFNEKKEGIRQSLENVRNKGLEAEKEVDISPTSSIKLCNEICEALSHVFMEKVLPEDLELMRNEKSKAMGWLPDRAKEWFPDTNAIWMSECYINAFMPEEYDNRDSSYIRDREKLHLYQELFKLKGEANCVKHSGKKEYRCPGLEGRNIKRWKEGNHAGEIRTYLVTISVDDLNTKIATRKNALTRLEETYKYMCEVLVKANYCKRDDLPEYKEPDMYSRVKIEDLNDVFKKNWEAVEIFDSFKKSLQSEGFFDTGKGDCKVVKISDDEARVIYEDGGIYIGGWKNGERNGKGRYTSSDGQEVYEGEWKDDERSGYGEIFLKDGSKYKGEWLEDNFEGIGTYTFHDGNYSEGGWRKGKRHGRNKMFEEDGTLIMESEWLDGIRNGVCKYYFGSSCAEVLFINGEQSNQMRLELNDGSVYVGQHDDDLNCHGQGHMTYKNGTCYEGEWKDGWFEKGIITYPDNSVFKGSMKKLEFDGYGYMRYSDGSIYTGNWEEGGQHGQGTMTYADGSSYDGEWKEGEKHGRGRIVFFDGSSFEGAWENGKIKGQGTLKFTDGSYREGEWKEDYLSGFLSVSGIGKIVYPNGGIYEGELDDNKRNGYGTMTYANRSVYKGEWSYDKQHGQGIMTYVDGSSFEGEWYYGKRKKGKMKFGDDTEFTGEWYKNELKTW